jgi:hypothetical protein
MPTQAQIQLQTSDALTDLQKERIREITRIAPGSEDFNRLEDRLTGASGVMNQILKAEIVQWDRIVQGTVQVKGGEDALNFDPERDRLAITQRVRVRLMFEELVTTEQKSGLQLIKIATNWRGRKTPEYG